MVNENQIEKDIKNITESIDKLEELYQNNRLKRFDETELKELRDYISRLKEFKKRMITKTKTK